MIRCMDLCKNLSRPVKKLKQKKPPSHDSHYVSESSEQVGELPDLMRENAAEARLHATNVTPGVLLLRDELGLWEFGPTRSPACRDLEVQLG